MSEQHVCCSGCDTTGHCSHGDPAEKERLAQALRDGDMETFTAAIRKANLRLAASPDKGEPR